MEKTRVLIIDDEQGFTSVLTINLEATGQFEVAVVNDPLVALRKAREFEPDVILLDVVMPGVDGGDLLILLRSDEKLKDTPVILVTALVDSRETAAGMGVAEEAGQIMLAKPTKLTTLIQVIENVLGQAGR